MKNYGYVSANGNGGGTYQPAINVVLDPASNEPYFADSHGEPCAKAVEFSAPQPSSITMTITMPSEDWILEPDDQSWQVSQDGPVWTVIVPQDKLDKVASGQLAGMAFTFQERSNSYYRDPGIHIKPQ